MKNLFFILIASALLTSCAKPEEDEPIDRTKPVASVVRVVPTIFAGGEGAASVDGTGREARFYQILKITADNLGNLYVLEAYQPGNYSFKIRKITPTGATSTLFDGAERIPSGGSTKLARNYILKDIAVAPDRTVYAVGSMVNYSILYREDNISKNYQEYGTYKLSGDSLKRVSISSTIANPGSPTTWVEAYNMLKSVTVDAGGNVFGAYGVTSGTGVQSGGKVYAITQTPTLIDGNTDAVNIATLSGDVAGTVYASTATDVLKISSSGLSSVYTFPAAKTSAKPRLVATQTGGLVIYGDVYDANKAFKGTGFYSISADGALTKGAYINSLPNVVTATITNEGVIYYAVELTAGGYIIYKTAFE